MNPSYSHAIVRSSLRSIVAGGNGNASCRAIRYLDNHYYATLTLHQLTDLPQTCFPIDHHTYIMSSTSHPLPVIHHKPRPPKERRQSSPRRSQNLIVLILQKRSLHRRPKRLHRPRSRNNRLHNPPKRRPKQTPRRRPLQPGTPRKPARPTRQGLPPKSPPQRRRPSSPQRPDHTNPRRRKGSRQTHHVRHPGLHPLPHAAARSHGDQPAVAGGEYPTSDGGFEKGGCG